ncbi:MAG TPA: YihY/virulence factor BrkB family protein [Bryobacteraceae bacterium]|jgi:membrane protein
MDRKPVVRIHWREIKSLLGESFDQWQRHNAARLGAALAFYALLSVAPLLLILISIVGLVFGHSVAERATEEQVRILIGPTAGDALAMFLEGTRNTTHGIVATVFGLIVLLLGASGVIIELRGALNTIWDVPEQDLSGMRIVTGFIKRRLFSFAIVMGVGVLLVASVAASTWINALAALLPSFPGTETVLLEIGSVILSFVLVAGLFAAIYKVMPDIQIEWRDVILGCLVTSLLFTIGKQLLTLYLGRASYKSTYGAAGSVVVFIAWVYYSSQIFFLGAEFTRIYSCRYGSHLGKRSNHNGQAISQTQARECQNLVASEEKAHTAETKSAAQEAGST